MVVGRTAVYGAQAGGPDNGSAVLGARESALLRAYQGRLSPWPRGQRPPLRPRVPIASETYMRVPDSDRRIRGAAGRNRLPARLRWEKGGLMTGRGTADPLEQGPARMLGPMNVLRSPAKRVLTPKLWFPRQPHLIMSR